MKRKLLNHLWLLAIFASSTVSAQTNWTDKTSLITNPSFEIGDAAPNLKNDIGWGYGAVTGWTVLPTTAPANSQYGIGDANSTTQGIGDSFEPSEGEKYFYVRCNWNANTTYGISQTIDAANLPEGLYKLTCKIATFSSSPASTKWTLSLQEEGKDAVTNTNMGSLPHWMNAGVIIYKKSDETTLTINATMVPGASGDNQHYAMLIDDVQLHYVSAEDFGKISTENPLDMSDIIYNAGIYNGGTATDLPCGWQEYDRGAGNNNRTEGTGDTQLEGWNDKTFSLDYYQTTQGLFRGLYSLTAYCHDRDGGGAKVYIWNCETEERMEGDMEAEYADVTTGLLPVRDGEQVHIGIRGVNIGGTWFTGDNFRLTYYGVPALDYSTLTRYEETLKGRLGFEAGLYAPYNCVEILQAIEDVKNDVYLTQDELDEAIKAVLLKAATLKPNTEEVNAIYDGNFAIQEAHENSGGLVLAGWDNSSDGMKQLIKNTTTCPGLNDATEKSAIYAWPGSYAYGEAEGYTMPLKANTVYELSIKICSWTAASSNDVSVSVLNTANEGLAMISLGRGEASIRDEEHSLISKAVRFKTGAADNYVLTIKVDGNTVFTDIVLKKAPAEDINVTFKADYGTMILPFDADIPEGMNVYSVTTTTPNGEYHTLDLVPVTDGIVANTPYIIQRTDEAQSDFVFTGVVYSEEEETNEYTNGLLTGVVKTDIEAPVGSYVLQDQAENGLAFYLVGSEVRPYVRAYHAYLTLPAEAAGVNALRLVLPGDDDATAISEVAAESATVDVYSISGVLVRKGVKVSEALNGLQKGIYVVNGVKKAVK